MAQKKTQGVMYPPNRGEDWDKWLIEETEKFESEKRQLEIDVSRMKENAHLKGELARLRAPHKLQVLLEISWRAEDKIDQLALNLQHQFSSGRIDKEKMVDGRWSTSINQTNTFEATIQLKILS